MNLITNGALIGLLTVAIVWALRKAAGRLKDNKWGTRGLAVLVCALWVVAREWVPDHEMTLEEFWQVFLASLSFAQLEYAWIIKTLDKMA